MINCSASGNEHIDFMDSSSAGSASFTITGLGFAQGSISFFDSSTAANATITVSDNAYVGFDSDTTAGLATITHNPGAFTFLAGSGDHGTFIMNGGTSAEVAGGAIYCQSPDAGGEGVFTAYGGAASGAQGGMITLNFTGGAADGTYLVNGSSVAGAGGAQMYLSDAATGDNASITVNGGTDGGTGALLSFTNNSLGKTAAIVVNGNGSMDISGVRRVALKIGSLAGDGGVALGAKQLQIGSNNQSTVFSGIIQDGGLGGSLSKIGTGAVTLSGASTYTGGTTVSAGALVVSNTTGSATGPGTVSITAGTLGGAGIVAGAVTVGDGTGAAAFLAPSFGVTGPTTLTIQSALTFKADGTYTCKATPKADQIIANGVTIESGAQFSLVPLAGATVKVGQKATVIKNTAATPIAGVFANLADGAILTVGSYHIQASYEGGNGNDLTLTVVP